MLILLRTGNWVFRNFSKRYGDCMTTQVLIVHAEGEENYAEELARPIREAGYEVVHDGTVMVGESRIREASKVLMSGGAVVLCGTIRAVGTRWPRQLVDAARTI